MVEFLEINGEKYPVRIGFHVMKMVQEETKKTFEEALEAAQENLGIHETILFGALQMGAYAQNKSMEIPFKKEEMVFVLDLCFFDYLDLFQSEKFFPKKFRDEVAKQVGKTKKGRA